MREALAAALELSGCESGFVALADGHGALYPHLAEGPFGVAFSQLASEEIASMASWVDDGTSTYTVGDTAGRGFVGHEVLRRTGVGSLIVLPLVVAGDRLGLIVVADRVNRRPAPEDIELLELLALQAATGLRMASVINELRERSARDPLTGLHASLPPLPDRTGVVLLDVDGLEEVNGDGGQVAGDDVLRATAGLLRELMPAGGQAFRIGADEFVVTLDPRHAASAESIGWELRSQAPARLGRTVSVGVAVGEPGESGEAVVLRAGVALEGVKRRDARRRRRRLSHHEVERSGPGGHALQAADEQLAVAVELRVRRQLDLDDRADEVRDSALALDRLRAQAPRAADELDPRPGRDDHDVELAVIGVGGADPGAAAERAGAGDDHLPRLAVVDGPAVHPHRGLERAAGQRRAGRADRIGERAEARLQRLRAARGDRSQPGAGDVHERPPVREPAELERAQLGAAGRQRRGLQAVQGELVGAREVVRGTCGDHRQRDVQATGELRDRRDRPVPARDRDPVRLERRDALELPRSGHQHLGAAHRRGERRRVEPAPRGAIGH